MSTPPPALLLRRLRRWVLARRRLLAAVLAALAVAVGVRAATAPPVETAEIVVAGADLEAGVTLSARHLAVTDLPVDRVPSGAATDVDDLAGRVLAAPLRQGEPVTDVRLVAPALLEGYPGLVGAPVRITDAGVARLLQVGDRVDLVATPPDGGRASVVVARAPVIAVPRPGRHDDQMTGGALVVVGVGAATALALAEAAVTSVVSVVLSG